MKLFALAAGALIALNAGSLADESADKAVREALQERTESICAAVLPTWFASRDEAGETVLRRAIVDCYLGYARLSALGGDDNAIQVGDTALSELPAALLGRNYDLNLDIYRPLAGKTFVIGKVAAR